MAISPPALDLVPSTESITVSTRSCLVCPTCRGGADLWCERPVEPREPHLLLDPGQVDELLAASALLEVASPQIVVIADPGATLLASLARRGTTAQVVVGDLADDDTRRAIAALHPTGRADVVVGLRRGRDLVKSVRRGGHVCLPAAQSPMPTITELVQREVTVHLPRSLTPVLDLLEPQSTSRRHR